METIPQHRWAELFCGKNVSSRYRHWCLYRCVLHVGASRSEGGVLKRARLSYIKTKIALPSQNALQALFKFSHEIGITFVATFPGNLSLISHRIYDVWNISCNRQLREFLALFSNLFIGSHMPNHTGVKYPFDHLMTVYIKREKEISLLYLPCIPETSLKPTRSVWRSIQYLAAVF